VEPAFLKRPPGAWERLACLLFPPSCAACAAPVESASYGALCLKCWRGAAWLEGEKARRVGPAWGFDSAAAAGSFEGALREAVHAYKFAGKTSFKRPFTSLLEAVAPPCDALAFPPSSAASLKERGFDAAQELAESLARRLKRPLFRGLKRARQGEKQAGLGRDERWLNAKGAFLAGLPATLQGKALLLVDDVITTGATLSECARALKASGAGRVDCVALASDALKGN
jgi:competence protein ComFC